MYYIKFYKKDNLFIYLYKDKILIDKFFCFGSLIQYLECNDIDFKQVKFKNFNVDLLFYHFVDYNSVVKKYNYNHFQELKKMKMESDRI